MNENDDAIDEEIGVGVLDEAYERGVQDAQAFIDRHPHGFPAMTMAQYGRPAWSKDEVERAYQQGWFDRLADEVGTEEDPGESWKQKMEAYDLWPGER